MADLAEPTDVRPKRYRLRVGLDYRVRGRWVRREAGEVCDDLPAVSLPWLLKQGLVEIVEEN